MDMTFSLLYELTQKGAYVYTYLTGKDKYYGYIYHRNKSNLWIKEENVTIILDADKYMNKTFLRKREEFSSSITIIPLDDNKNEIKNIRLFDGQGSANEPIVLGKEYEKINEILSSHLKTIRVMYEELERDQQKRMNEKDEKLKNWFSNNM